MAIKGQKESAETRAKKSAVQKARWAKIKEQRAYAVEHEAIHAAHPRCKRSLFQRVVAWFVGGK
jgi:hypothetical protein